MPNSECDEKEVNSFGILDLERKICIFDKGKVLG
jgi:hypothetical protein